MIVTPAEGFAAVVSELVLTLNSVLAMAPAVVRLVMPAIVRVAAVLLPRAQEAPARVIVTVCPAVEPVAVQLAKPLVRPIVGLAGIVKPAGKTTAIVRVAFKEPVALAVKPTVQVAVAPTTSELPANVTLAGAVAALIVTDAAGFTVAVSTLVLTLNVVFA
jgi:hypothetical protein